MPDKREQILVRLLAILDDIDDFETVGRNRGFKDNDARPCAILLDNDEEIRVTGDRRGRQRMQVTVTTMRPQIHVVAKVMKVTNLDADGVNIGTILNSYRILITDAIAKDLDLLNLVGPNGDVAYEGCETDLKLGDNMEGQMLVKLALSYAFDPYQP